MPLIYLALAALSFVIVCNKVKNDVLHPVAILTSIWFFTASIASLQWGIYQQEWSFMVHLTIICSGILCWVSGYLAIRQSLKTITVEQPVNGTYRVVTRIVFVVLLICVLFVLTKNEISLNYLRNLDGLDIKTVISNKLSDISSFESYLINLFPFCAIFSFFELVYTEKGKQHFIYNTIVILIVFLYCMKVIYSRGTLLYVFLGFMFIYNSKKKISIRTFVAAAVGILVFLGIMMQTRVFSGSVVFANVEHINNPILVSAYNYIAYSFENLNIVVQNGSRYMIFANVFQTLYKVMGIYDPMQTIANDVAGVFNSLTWLSPFFDDLGFFGVLLYPMLIGAFLSHFYNKGKYNKYYILLLAVLQKAIFVPFFGNYFLTSLSVMFPYVVTGILCFLCRKIKIILPEIKFTLARR